MKSNKKVLILLGIIVLALSACSKEAEVYEKTEFLMDTVINLKIYDGKNEKAMEEGIERIKDIEKIMSAHLEDSDLSKINENAGIKPVKVDESLYYVINKSIEIAEISEAAYEPTIGPLVKLWDIKEGSSKRDRLPSEKDIEEAKALVDYKKIQMLDNNQVFLEEEGMSLDLGGIVKGYAADEVRDIFIENGVESAIIDLGGNIYTVGSKLDGEDWKIGIQDPINEDGTYMGIIKLSDKTIVTSGDYERYFEYEGERYHHIIDSKTGYPSKSDLSGISIISENSMEADALSTAVFVLGKNKGKELLEKIEATDAIYILKDKNVFIDKNLVELFELTDKNFVVN